MPEETTPNTPKKQNFVATIRDFIAKNRKPISLSLVGLLCLSLFGAIVYVQSSPEYSLYKLHQAVQKNDVKTFSKYWHVDPEAIMAAPTTAPATAEDIDADATKDEKESITPEEAIKIYKEKYYYDMSLVGAFKTTDVHKEKISPGAVVFLNGKQPETAMRLVRERGHWVVVEFTALN